jgi:hypothetical protein
MKNEEDNTWPESVISRLKPYAERTEKTFEEAIREFTDFLRAEYNIENPKAEDEFYLGQWAEQFVIPTRNLGPMTSGGKTVTWVGHMIGLDEYINDMRANVMSGALSVWEQDSNRAIEQKYLGVVTAKDGNWCVNGEPTKETIEGGKLPWFGFEHDDRILCLLNRNENSEYIGTPIAPTSLTRTIYFLGNLEGDGFDSQIKEWRINVSGENMEAQYELHTPCSVQVRAPKDSLKDNRLYTNRDFCKTIIYGDGFVSDDMKIELQADRFLPNDRIHNAYAELDDLMEAYDERKIPNPKGGYYHPYAITKGYVSRMNKEPSDSQYDQTGRSYRLSITSLALQARYGKDGGGAEVTVWIPGRTYDDSHPFEYKNDKGEWQSYAERTQVIIYGKIRLSEFNGVTSPSLTAYGIYVPPRTARPGATGGDTNLNQFDENASMDQYGGNE